MPSIVSLNPCADAILHEVAAPGQLLSISHYSHDPRSSSMMPGDAPGYPSNGGTAEEVIALGPDVVVADIFMPPATRSALENAGIRVELLGIAGTLEESHAQIRQLAAVTGEAQRGEQLVARIDTAWNSAAFSGSPVNTLLWQAGGIVPGEQSLASAMLEHTGFASHAASRGLGQGAYLPLEEVLSDPPSLVLAAGNERMLSHPVLRQLDNVRYDTFDSALLYCGGPSIPRALARLAEIRDSSL
ncbi:ABC transporter substrate-binding protein [Aurantiacibacter marinus]|uniref:ABC transporter substrate-binding protein n=1 Tax=Aurantiacibacter marinus TaxID=874156 RepID=UPI001E39590E|nr:ABC transporter substrate-binding protein [Aurantiacibacter marinus]